MEWKADYKKAREILLNAVTAIEIKQVPLEESTGMVLAQELKAVKSVPAFSRSPYDGFAFCSSDSKSASKDAPVALKITGEVAAGDWPRQPVIRGTAVKIMTGAPVPEGADAIVMYEKTEFTDTTVRLSEEMKSGDNIIYAGEDMKAGDKLAEKGSVIDSGLAGALAAQGVFHPFVFRRPKIGVISTGNEVSDSEETLAPGKVYNTNRYTLTAELMKMGCEPRYYGIAEDSEEEIANLILSGLKECDAVLLTGGVSAGKYDLTPAAMERAGINILVRGVKMKPGMACVYGEKDGKIICGLSGNPAASITNFYMVVMPALKKLAGRKDCLPEVTSVMLADSFNKKSKITRILRGRADLSGGIIRMGLSYNQGNGVISSSIGCNVLAVVPEGSGCLNAGTILKGFMIGY